MAGAIGSIGVLLPRRCAGLNLRRCTPRGSRSFAATGVSAFSVSSSTGLEANQQDLNQDTKSNSEAQELACPICYFPLTNQTNQSTLDCQKCKKSYVNNGTYFDLTISGNSTDYSETMPALTELFRTPLVSYLYERGWRQNFVWGGFPGPEKEFEMAKEYLKPTIGGTIVDASCGSGLFSRLFVKSQLYSQVIAFDFSENMLRQCDEFVRTQNIPTQNLVLVRADISRLPFGSSSIDAVHAGAALHCWPSPASAVAEISRVLRPGGVFVATTFIVDVVMPAVPVLRIARQYFAQFTSNTIYVSEKELEELCTACGLVGFTCVRNGLFVMISATKPR
ncbi:hypothetical protein LUZ60_003024 [Juncus effusus]|nr:hypothetical protein LUZ60_003024 [Juncus effusus]